MADKEISVKELTAYYLKNIEEKNKDINAYLEVFDDALSEAEKLDKEGIGERPLGGIPLAIKDNILIKGKICSTGSKMLQNYKASYNATVIKKLKEAGVVFLSRTNMDEFAMGASTENSAHGATKKSPRFKPGGRRIVRRQRRGCGDGRLFGRSGFGHGRFYQATGVFLRVVPGLIRLTARFPVPASSLWLPLLTKSARWPKRLRMRK